ncbi:mitochondrial fission process protein 1-like [Babylonia areolata]|uniref:mitochondrial fission process protein 1-like n=1 Tax=Babylonia areolata TaxID=304850 RepID=UPI003FD0A273
MLADATDKGWRECQKARSPSMAKPGSPVVAFTDTLIWQGLASIAIPGFTINRICFLTGWVLARSTSLPPPLRKWGTTAVGLGCIPFIVHPIDRSVNFLMDHTVRSWYKHHSKGTSPSHTD